MEFISTYDRSMSDAEKEADDAVGDGIISGNKHHYSSCVDCKTSDGSVTRTESTSCFQTQSPQCINTANDDFPSKDYFSLQNDSSGSETEIVTNTCSEDKQCVGEADSASTCPSGSVRSYVADESFWHEGTNSENWEETSVIWPNFSGDTDTANDSSSCIQNSQSNTKRTRYDQTEHFSAGQLVKQSEESNVRLEKSCFYVHHKIAPRLSGAGPKVSIPRQCQVELPGHGAAINRIKWCGPQHSHLLLSASMDKTVKVWNVFSQHSPCVQTLSHHQRAVKDAKWSSDGHQILSCGYDQTCRLLDVEQGVCIQCFKEDSYVTSVEYHPVNYHMFLSGSSNRITAWDSRAPQKPARIFRYKDVFGQVVDLEFLPNGMEFFTCNDLVSRDSADRNVMAWDFTKGIVISNQMYQERYTCTRLRVAGSQLLAQTQGDYIAEFSTIRPYRINKCRRYEGHKVAGYTVGFDVSCDGELVVSGSADGRVPFYSRRSGAWVGEVALGGGAGSGGSEVCLDVSWHPILPSTLALATWSGRLVVWV